MYGDATAHTPNLNQLAKESLIYNNAFANVGVCGPSRSSIITGMHPTSIGTMHMRTGKDITSWGKRKYKSKIPVVDIQNDSIREYSVVLPEQVKCFSEYLRVAGYFCTNNQKTDYQFAAPLAAWDENDAKAHWRNCPEDKPFFSVFNINLTHESKLWKHKDLPLSVEPSKVPVPPYLPDTEEVRKDIARHYSNVELMDAEVGKLIKQLKEDGLYDNTIVFFYSDHGGPLPRQKREIYDSGLKVPFFVKQINSKNKGKTDRMISFVDLAPTMLSFANIPAPDYMEGKAFLGKHKNEERRFVYGSSDRFDGNTDRSRMVRSNRYLYVRNFLKGKSNYKEVNYRKNIPSMNSITEMKENGALNEVQMQWFKVKETEELYDCTEDPHNLTNLVKDTLYKDILRMMRVAFLEKQRQAVDWGQMPEAQMIDMMWPDGKQPKTEMDPIVEVDGLIYLGSLMPGTSISYILSEKPIDGNDWNQAWLLYTEPFMRTAEQYLYVVAERIGYQPEYAEYAPRKRK